CDTQAPAAEALAPFAAEFCKLLPDLGTLLPTISPSPPLEPELEKRLLFHTLTQFILQRPAPALLVIEDIHWSDDISLEFLLRLAARIGPGRIRWLLPDRLDEAHADTALPHFLAELDRRRLAVELTLGRLSREDVERMIRSIFAQERPIRAEFVEALYALT